VLWIRRREVLVLLDGSLMEMSLSVRRGPIRKHWERTGALLLALAVVVLLATVFAPRTSSGRLAFLLPATVLNALCTAFGFQARFMLQARREHRETSGVLDATEREFQSIFDNALDGILIFDDDTTCLEANPAALTLFGTERNEMVGRSFRECHSPVDHIATIWELFLDRSRQHGELQFARPDGARVFVEYTVTANYLPRRHVAILRDISVKKHAEAALRDSDERFRQMARCIREIYWLLDAETKRIIYANEAYETITGRSLASLRANPSSYQEMLHPEDRVRFQTRLNEAATTGELDEEFRIVRPDGVVRWLSVRGFPVRDSEGVIRRLVGISQDISARKSAEEEMAKSLLTAESSRAEADAFRKITLALTQNLRMDCVLDTLLESLLQLIPCESARILLVEADTRLFVEREVQHSESGRHPPKCPDTLDATDIRFLMRVLTTKKSVLVPDTAEEPQWSDFRGHAHLGSWLCVPLIADQQVLGLLSLGGTNARTFTQDHLRLAKSLAIPAAVAIQNARLYERAEIYSVELEQRLAELESTKQALQRAQQRNALSEQRFTKVFRSSPIAFSITTMDEGHFIEANEAFEMRCGYTRQELLSRAVVDLAFWDSLSERSLLLDEVRRVGHVRNRPRRFRRRFGQVLETLYSADIIEFGGQPCIFAVSEEVHDRSREGRANSND
jgi:PAS domain S-box-containing protein